MIQNDKTNTIATSNDQFICYGYDMYNQRLTGDKSRTLKTPKGGDDNPVVLYCFEPGVMSRDGGHIYEDGKSCVIRAMPGDNRPCVAYTVGVDPYNGAECGEKCSTLGLNAGMSTGRNGVLCVLNDQGGGVIMAENGEKSPCLRSQMKHHEPIVFALDRAAYNQGEHAQYNIGVDDTGGRSL